MGAHLFGGADKWRNRRALCQLVMSSHFLTEKTCSTDTTRLALGSHKQLSLHKHVPC